MEITKEMIKKEVVFHCDTEEKASELLGKLDYLGYKWVDGESYLSNNCYHGRRENNCYYPHSGTYSDVSFSKINNYKIIEYVLDRDIKFTMDDIKDGYLTELRNGDKYLCFKSIDDKKVFVSYDGFKCTTEYRLDLICRSYNNKDFSKYDIVKVYGRSAKPDCLLSLKTYNRKLLWERKEENKMELKDTVKMMNSEDFKERFKAEYFRTKIRYDKLDEMTVKYEAGTLTFEPSCPLELLKEQKKHMGCYIRCLKIRAEIEGIDLS